MEKKAFVVMPYDQKFNRVYSMLIKDAVERAGYECVRQDMAAQGGYILKNVIRNLAESDLVICLLSDFNWNVAYELGMRHTLARKGTILMCQKDQEKDMKFDLKGTNILFYDANWLDLEQDEQIINEILKMIQGIESRNESDSPVYDTYPELPNDLIQFVTSDQSEAVKKLQDENTALKKALEDAGLTKKEDTPHTDFRKTLMEAINNNVFTATMPWQSCGNSPQRRTRPNLPRSSPMSSRRAIWMKSIAGSSTASVKAASRSRR